MTNCSASGGVTRISAAVERYDREKGEGVLLPADGSPGILCRRPALAAVGLDTLLPGATVDCEAVEGEHGPEVSRIHAVDFAAASPGTASVDRVPVEGPAADQAGADASDRRVRGIVKWFHPDKGYGFVEPEDGAADVFCHLSVVQASGRETLPQGAVVECEAVDGGRGLQASRILSVEPPAPGRVPARPRRAAPDRRADGTLAAEVTDLPGTVKFYNPARGFGFVAPDRGGPEVFVHASVLERCGMDDPPPGQRVLVRAESVPRGLQATGIEPL